MLLVLGITGIAGVHGVYDRYLHMRYPLTNAGDIFRCYEEYNLDPSFVSAVIYEESRFNPAAHSGANALGLMQIVPETGKYLAGKMGHSSFDPQVLRQTGTNIAYGCYYLSLLSAKYQEQDKVLAAYNAGPGTVDQWLAEGDYAVKFKETEQFVARVTRSEGVYRSLYFPEIPQK